MEKTIARINELARKAKSVGLTEAEQEERSELRKQYIESFKSSLKVQLDSIKFADDESKNT